MPTYGEQLGMRAADQVQGAILGLMNDDRQLRQQGKLQRLSIAGSKELTDYNFQKQMELWNATNYPAQVEQLKKAGLSIGLMYGGSGAGGSTTNIQQGSTGQANAPAGGREVQDMMGMGMMLQKAQIENIQAQTRKTNIEADKTENVDTHEAETRIQLNMQGVKNQQAVEALTKAQTRIANMNAYVAEGTSESAIDKIQYEAQAAFHEMNQARYSDYVASKTMAENIQLVQTAALQAILNTYQTRANTAQTKQQTQQAKELFPKQRAALWQSIQESMARVSQLYKNGEINQARLTLQQAIENQNLGFDPSQIMQMVNGMEGIFRMTPQGYTPIQGFNQRY